MKYADVIAPGAGADLWVTPDGKARKSRTQEAEDAAECKIQLAQSDPLPRTVRVRVTAAKAK